MKTVTLKIADLVCCGDEKILTQKLAVQPHITKASISLVNNLATITYHQEYISAAEIKRLISDCGFHCDRTPPLLSSKEALAIADHKMEYKGKHKTVDHEAMMTDPSMAKTMEQDMKRRFFISLFLSLPIILLSPLGVQLLKLDWSWLPFHPNWILLILTSIVVFGAGSIFPKGAIRAIKNKTLNMMVLISTGVFAAYGFSVLLMLFVSSSGDTFFEASAMLVTFVLFGHWMEMKSRKGTSESLRALFDLVPPKARVLKNGQEVIVPTAELKIGDIIILKPGDKVPVDGQIIEGQTTIDESLVTGESLPVSKKINDQVIGGSINQSGSVKFKATKVGEATALAQIVKLVADAQASKAPGQRLADKAAQYLVILAVGSGLLTFAVWFFIIGQPLLFALTFAISAVVIACPDALGLATPTAVAVGTGLGAKHNILIKDAATLEQASKIEVVVLDKTGTLTAGKPVVTDVIPAPGFDKKEILRLDAAAELKSGHPLSSAILNEVKRQKISLPDQIIDFKNLAGHGVQAVVEGKKILVGTVKLMKDNQIDIAPIQKNIDNLLSQGKTLMILAVDGRVAGIIGAQDPLKKTALAAVKKLQQLNIEVAMITGDNQKTAQSIADQLAIKRVFAEVLPEDKAKYVKKLQAENKFVAMVGDGVNDAPALAQADIGIAIGAGTDVAIETAKIVLMKSDPADILRAIRLSKATVRKMKQNLGWATIYNILAIPIAAGLFYRSLGLSLRPEISALLMSASSIIVATNAVLLKRAEKDLIGAV